MRQGRLRQDNADDHGDKRGQQERSAGAAAEERGAPRADDEDDRRGRRSRRRPGATRLDQHRALAVEHAATGPQGKANGLPLGHHRRNGQLLAPGEHFDDGRTGMNTVPVYVSSPADVPTAGKEFRPLRGPPLARHPTIDRIENASESRQER